MSLIVKTKPTFAQSPCGDGICSSPEDYTDCSWDDFIADCGEGDVCYSELCEPPQQPENICCTTNNTSSWPVSSSHTFQTWDYAYNAQCALRSINYVDQKIDCSWAWQYQNCSAADRCIGTGSEKVYAGICDTGGCTTGGWCKTCCEIVSDNVYAGAQLTGQTDNCDCYNSGNCTNGARIWDTSCNGCLLSVDAWGTCSGTAILSASDLPEGHYYLHVDVVAAIPLEELISTATVRSE